MRSSILKERIIELRKKGRSYNEISGILGIAKSTVGYWVANDPDSQAVKKILTERNLRRSIRRVRNLVKAMKEKWSKWRQEIITRAENEYPKFENNPLFIAGLVAYWGEGDSNPKNPLRIANTDPRMIRCFVNFLREIMGVRDEKIKLGLFLYPDLNEAICKRFWAEVTGLNSENFVKTQYLKGYHPTKRLAYGICIATVSTREHKLKVLKWIDIFSESPKIMGHAGIS